MSELSLAARAAAQRVLDAAAARLLAESVQNEVSPGRQSEADRKGDVTTHAVFT